MIKGQGIAQESIWQLFGHVVWIYMILNGNVILIWVKDLSLVVHGIDPMSEDVQLRDKLL